MKNFTKGIFKENPVFVIALGLCPALAVSSRVWDALGMGAGVIFVLVCSNLIISLLKDFIPDEVHIPAYIVVIASFVTIVDLIMQAYIPSLSKSLGVFVPLIVVNCVILGRAEAFASNNKPLASVIDGLGMGIGFTLALTAIAFVREILGKGKITVIEMGDMNVVLDLPYLSDNPVALFSYPAGALLVMGLFKALFTYIENRGKMR